jgi:hypothetical protein
MKPLYCVAVISNPVRYSTRYKLFQEFMERVEKAPNAVLYVVEQAFGERPFVLTDANNPRHVQVRTFEEFWHKENMINLGFNRIVQQEPDAEYLAWIDGDVAFARNDWALETVHQLQHHMVVQMFSHAIDLGPEQQPIQTHNGFVWSYFQNLHYPPRGPGYDGKYSPKKGFWHPGYAWAARREAIDALGGLIDWSLGSADHSMALALIGQVRRSVPSNIGTRFLRKLLVWENRANRFIQRDIGFVPGTLTHFWHGKKKNRKYVERWEILIKNCFDPDNDLKRDSQGLWQLVVTEERQERLRDEIRAYFRQRHEDSIDLE